MALVRWKQMGRRRCSTRLGMNLNICVSDITRLILRAHSWNNISNSTLNLVHMSRSQSSDLFITVIYIDQPIGTGFSFGTVDVNSTFAAAPAVWQAFQVLFESQQFAKFQSREYVYSTPEPRIHLLP